VSKASKRHLLGNSYRIQHDIGAGVRGEPLDRFIDALLAVVDQTIGAN
jgi:hypothetical protein